MNWKIIVGIIIILASAKEMYAEVNDYQTGVTHFNPIYAEVGCLSFAALGVYLIIKGRKKTVR